MPSFQPSWYIYTPKGHFKSHIKVAFLREVELTSNLNYLQYQDRTYKTIYSRKLTSFPTTVLVSFQQWKDGSNWAVIKEL